MRLILASGSPRRRELLGGIGIGFDVVVSDVEEKQEPGEAVDAYVRRLARDKGAAVAATHPDAWVLSADTVVFIDGHVLEKPTSRDDARAMLAKIAGREHVVYTGVALQNAHAGFLEDSVTASKVRMIELTPDEIAWYVDTGEPMDKAGSYAVQGIGAMFIESIDGSYSNVVGLPLSVVYDMLKRAGVWRRE
ncbi:MAG: Maf family protein [Thermoanaerobaculia bacterium]|jgi:septum formation protein